MKPAQQAKEAKMFGVGAVQKSKARTIARLCVTLGVIMLFSTVGMVLTAAAPPDPCQDVWEGQTQTDPLVKIADPATAFPGDQVTYHFEWHSTGAPTASLEDCYRVDAGGSSLDALVSGFYHNVDIDNQGDNGDLQVYEYTITIPNDASLIGHKVVNRAKMTKGSVESRTGLVEVSIVAPPCTENCGGGTSTGSSTGETSTGSSTGTSSTGETSTGTSTSGSSTGETSTTTTGGSSTTGGAENGTTTGTQVLGKQITKKKPLATTGNETTILAVFGFAFLLLGSAMRFGRFGTRVAMATASPADELVARSLALIERTVRPSSRDWYCH